MSCKRWPAPELHCKADLLAYLLLGNEHVNGVALTGSVARDEQAHDIDLMVLHDGLLPDSRCRIPFPVHEQKTDYFGHITQDGGWKRIENVIGREIGVRLWEAAGGTTGNGSVPVEFFFVHEQALWDCGYLQKLVAADGSDFYLTVFCDIPLLLLNPESCRGGLVPFSRKLDRRTWSTNGSTEPVYSFSEAYIKHHCGSPKCNSFQPWEEKRKEILARKKCSHLE